MKKYQNSFLFFYLHLLWLWELWHHQRILKNQPSYFQNGWFSSEVSKLTSVFYLWNDAFSGMEQIDFHKYCPVFTCTQIWCHNLITNFWPRTLFFRCGILLAKLFWPIFFSTYQEIWGWRLGIYKNFEQVSQTVKSQNNFW